MRHRTILITGASSGIGRALAIHAANAGDRLILVGRNQSRLDETCAMLEGRDHQIIPADIATKDGRAAIRAQLPERLDILINNAGVVAACPHERISDEQIFDLVNTNVGAALALARDAYPMLKAAEGQLVNLGSVFGDIAYPYFAAYSSSKFALRGFSDGLRREWAHDGIAVTYVAPRATNTAAAGQFAELVGPLKMKLDAPERVAEYAWRGINARKREVFPPSEERIFVRIARLFPALIDKSLKKLPIQSGVRAAFNHTQIKETKNAI